MMRSKYVIGLVLAVIVVSCGGEAQKTMEAIDNMKSMTESADDAAKSMEATEQLQKDRIARGDTIAMPYKDLQQFLPGSFSGYTMGTPEGESVQMPGMSHSRASAEYTKPDGSRIRVNIMDYNGGMMGYAGATAMFAFQMKVDNDDETAGTFQTSNSRVNGYQRFGKKDGNSRIILGIAGRFFVEVEGSKPSSMDDVKAAVAALKVDDLAKK